jgi:hypothetical protein
MPGYSGMTQSSVLLSSPGRLCAAVLTWLIAASASSRHCARRVNGGTARPRRAASSCHAVRVSAWSPVHICRSQQTAGASNSNTQKSSPASVGTLGKRGATVRVVQATKRSKIHHHALAF